MNRAVSTTALVLVDDEAQLRSWIAARYAGAPQRRLNELYRVAARLSLQSSFAFESAQCKALVADEVASAWLATHHQSRSIRLAYDWLLEALAEQCAHRTDLREQLTREALRLRVTGQLDNYLRGGETLNRATRKVVDAWRGRATEGDEVPPQYGEDYESAQMANYLYQQRYSNDSNPNETAVLSVLCRIRTLRENVANT